MPADGAVAPPRATPLHIGIVGCSAEGAALCYRTVCTEAPSRLGGHAHPPVSMHTPSLDGYVQRLDDGDLPGVAALMLDSARRLAAAGAELLICPDNTIHQAWPWVQPHTPLPWLHIADAVGSAARAQGHRRVGLMGTHWLVASDVYPTRLAPLGIQVVKPDAASCRLMGRVIMDELVRGQPTTAGVQALLGVAHALAREGCDAVVLGCTELPLVIDARSAGLPVLDSTRLLARAALDHALGQSPDHSDAR